MLDVHRQFKRECYDFAPYLKWVYGTWAEVPPSRKMFLSHPGHIYSKRT